MGAGSDGENDMAAVELSAGQEIQGGSKHSHPCRNCRRGDESGDRPGDTDIKQSGTGTNGGTDSYERSEGSDQSWGGNKKRQGCPDSIVLAIQVMAHFVGHED